MRVRLVVLIMEVSVKYWFELTPVAVRSDELQLHDLHRMLVVAVQVGITSVDEIYSLVNSALAGRETQDGPAVNPQNPTIPERKAA